jgi:ABC-type polysaccharide/polyol phosphate transport system ATPase subunit
LSDIALQVHQISKSFRVARAHGGGTADPRRERLNWRHDRFHALRDVSFSLQRGQTLGIIGHNGSGKSTLLKILSGVMTPDSGRFEAAGRIGALLELGAGFHPELSGVDNVYLNGALLGLTNRDVDRLLPEIIAFAELERFMDMPVKHYSSGMTARLGFAVATRLAPEILLLDETFATGDARFQVKAFEHMASMRAGGLTMVVVSHNLELMMRMVDRVLWLDHGMVKMDGPVREVLAEYRHSRADLETAGIKHSVLGVESIFEDADPARQTVKIEAVRWRTEECGMRNAECGMSNVQGPMSNVGSGVGGTELTKESNPQSTAHISHSDSSIPHSAFRIPHSEIPLEMGQFLVAELDLSHPAGHPAQVAVETAWGRDEARVLAQTRATVVLAEGERTTCAVRIGPWRLTEGVWQGALALAPIAGECVPGNYLYYDSLPQATVVHIVTPNPIEIQVVTLLKSRWIVE